jgi:rhodanese-related sulfurtransferase
VAIEHILETHNHADHVSGHGRLAAATGATLHVHRLAAPDYEHDPFDDGWELELGRIRIRALHTPGHRPEHTAFALIDTGRGPEPWAVLTGDTLFVGDVARPDLAVEKVDGATGLFESLQQKLLSLPDVCEVWPGHLGGSLCGGPGMDMKVSSTIGYERDHNPLLQISDENEFVDALTGGLPPQPPNFQQIVGLNRGPLVDGTPHYEALTPRELDARQNAGALVVDVRTDREFDEAHIPGAICNPAVRAGYGTKLGWVATDAPEVVLVGRDGDDALRAARLAASVGLRNVAGWLAGGMTTWRAEGMPIASIERIDVDELHERIDDVQLLDVREQREWDEFRIEGARHVPYHQVRSIPDGVDRGAPLAVICSSGQRSAVAASVLSHHGLASVIHVADGGVGTWRDRGYATQGAAAALAR